MKNCTNKPLIWWRDVPVDVEWGLLDYLAKYWENDIYIVCAHDFAQDRKICSWDMETKDNIHFIVGDLKTSANKGEIEWLMQRDALHIFSGIKGGHKWCLDLLKKKYPKGQNSIIIMESPSLYGSWIKRVVKKIMYPVIYRYYYMKYGKMFLGLLTIGKEAKATYSSYGWENDKIYPFMYLPRIETSIRDKKVKKSAEVKVLYLGRFEYATKGVNVLMNAIDNVNIPGNWHFDFVGGYGAQRDEVIQWCNKTSNVNYIGSWRADTVIKNMKEYDFCIVPSLYDGWNMAPFQAINAGIGCVISNRAGSNELIESSKAGEVYSVDDCDGLRDILIKVISNPDIVNDWKEKSNSFQEQISQKKVGDYFVNIIQYCFGQIEQKPSCPW